MTDQEPQSADQGISRTTTWAEGRSRRGRGLWSASFCDPTYLLWSTVLLLWSTSACFCRGKWICDGRVFIRSWCRDPDFRDRHLRKKIWKFSFPGRKPKSAVDTQKTKKNRRLGIRCWDPNLSGGYQNCSLGIHPWEIFQNRSGKNSEFFSKV